MSCLADSITSPYSLMLERWILAFSYIQSSTVLLERVLCMEIANGLFSWFKNESICPDVRTLNATIFVHSTPKTFIGKEYCVWRSQMCCLGDLNTSSYVLMLERWMLPFSYIEHQRLLWVRDVVYEDCKVSYLADSITSPYGLMLERWILAFSYIQRSTVLLERVLCMEIANGLFSWFKNESICPDVKTLNSTIFVHLTPKTIIGKEYWVWGLQICYLSDLSTTSFGLMLERWMLPYSFIHCPRVLLVKEIVDEDCKWVIYLI